MLAHLIEKAIDERFYELLETNFNKPLVKEHYEKFNAIFDQLRVVVPTEHQHLLFRLEEAAAKGCLIDSETAYKAGVKDGFTLKELFQTTEPVLN